MTPEEKQTLLDRISEADLQDKRRKNLENALRKLASEGVGWLKFNVKGDTAEMYYSARRDSNEYRLCWFNEEAGLREQITEFIEGQLRQRLEEAKRKYTET